MDYNKKRSLEAGYVAFGYFSPELSSSEVYPKYIQNEVKRCVDEIQLKQSMNSVSFAFMTDIHYSHTFNHNIRMKRTMNAYREIASRTGIDMLVLGGDYTNDGIKEYKINNYRELRRHLMGASYFPVNGNHDDNSIWDIYAEEKKSINHLQTEELYTLFFNHLHRQGVQFDKNNPGLYYLYDDTALKIRYVFLDSNDIPIKYDENGQLIYKKQHTFALSQQQTDWLINHALQFDEEGWSIVLVAHSAVFPGEKPEEEAINLAFLNEIISFYTKGERLQKTYNSGDFTIDVNVDFSTYARGTIIGIFAGHYHDDRIYKDENGTPYIYIGNAIMYNTKLPRVDGEKSELLFDIITIDKAKRMIYLTRVGAGENREISY